MIDPIAKAIANRYRHYFWRIGGKERRLSANTLAREITEILPRWRPIIELLETDFPDRSAWFYNANTRTTWWGHDLNEIAGATDFFLMPHKPDTYLKH
jgi:hypothetical protein